MHWDKIFDESRISYEYIECKTSVFFRFKPNYEIINHGKGTSGKILTPSSCAVQISISLRLSTSCLRKVTLNPHSVEFYAIIKLLVKIS